MEGAAVPVGEVDFFAVAEVFEDDLFHGAGEGVVVDGDVSFVVEDEAAFVDVGGADECESVVDDECFGVDEWRVAFVDSDACGEEFFVEGFAGESGVAVVVFFGDDEADVDAAQGGGAEGAEDVDGGDEVGGDGEDLFFGEEDGVEEDFDGGVGAG